MSIELNCKTCGNNRFLFPDDDQEPVRCQFCGDSIGTLAEVQEKVAEEVMRVPRVA